MKKLHIDIKGQGKEALVFFHGWGFDHQIWSSTIDSLATCYRCYAVDLPGFGQSELMDWNDFITALLATLPSSYTLIGWSLGGLFSTRLAYEKPHAVKRLINVASSPCFMAKQYWSGLTQEQFDDFLMRLSANPSKTLKQFIALQLPNFKLNLDLKAPSSQALAAGLEILKTWDLRSSLPKISCPISYIFGGRDVIVPWQTYIIMKEKFSFIEFHPIKDAAHAPFLSHPQLFEQIIKN